MNERQRLAEIAKLVKASQADSESALLKPTKQIRSQWVEARYERMAKGKPSLARVKAWKRANLAKMMATYSVEGKPWAKKRRIKN